MGEDKSTAEPTLAGLQRQLFELQIEAVTKNLDDHEKRLRLLEDTATRFNFLLYLTMGGGFVSLINLAAMLVMISMQAAGK